MGMYWSRSHVSQNSHGRSCSPMMPLTTQLDMETRIILVPYNRDVLFVSIVSIVSGLEFVFWSQNQPQYVLNCSGKRSLFLTWASPPNGNCISSLLLWEFHMFYYVKQTLNKTGTRINRAVLYLNAVGKIASELYHVSSAPFDVEEIIRCILRFR